MAHVRAVRTASGAVAVQVVWKSSRGSRDIEHLGSAHTEAQVEVLKAVAAQRIAAGQDQLPLDVAAPQEPMVLEIVSSRMGRLLDAIAAVYRQLGFEKACGREVVFEQLVTARIIEPTSKQAASRVLAEAGVRPLSYRTVKRTLYRTNPTGPGAACTASSSRSPGNLPLHRSPDRLDDQEIRPRPPPLPDRQDQHRQPHPDRRRPPARRRPPSARRDPPGCALIWPNSGRDRHSAAKPNPALPLNKDAGRPAPFRRARSDGQMLMAETVQPRLG